MSVPNRIALALGDPNGIGPEIALKALAAQPAASLFRFTVFGPGDVLHATAERLARIFHRSRATNEYGIALVCPKIQVSNLDQRAGNAEAKLYRRN